MKMFVSAVRAVPAVVKNGALLPSLAGGCASVSAKASWSSSLRANESPRSCKNTANLFFGLPLNKVNTQIPYPRRVLQDASLTCSFFRRPHSLCLRFFRRRTHSSVRRASRPIRLPSATPIRGYRATTSVGRELRGDPTVAVDKQVFVKVGSGNYLEFEMKGLWTATPGKVLEALAERRAFSVKLKDVPLDECKVSVVPPVAGDVPTAEEEENAIEVTTTKSIQGSLTSGHTDKVFIRVELPSTGPKHVVDPALFLQLPSTNAAAAADQGECAVAVAADALLSWAGHSRGRAAGAHVGGVLGGGLALHQRLGSRVAGSAGWGRACCSSPPSLAHVADCYFGGSRFPYVPCSRLRWKCSGRCVHLICGFVVCSARLPLVPLGARVGVGVRGGRALHHHFARVGIIVGACRALRCHGMRAAFCGSFTRYVVHRAV